VTVAQLSPTFYLLLDEIELQGKFDLKTSTKLPCSCLTYSMTYKLPGPLN